MILDKLLFEQISPIGKSFIEESGIKCVPKNYIDMSKFLKTIDDSIKNEKSSGLLIGNIFFSFVSSIEVRDRQTTSRIFEDIFSGLFGSKPTDTSNRQNPAVPESVLELDSLNSSTDDWKISTDLAANKREKVDLYLEEYPISLKTLKGIAYDENGLPIEDLENDEGEKVSNKENDELNVGSLSYRALLKGILSDEELNKLKDRKGGLGSGGALREYVFDKIVKRHKKRMFQKRLSVFLNYVYDEDVYIVLKSHYKIIWYLIPSSSFKDCIIKTYKKDEPNFQKIWYRWENNNLRLNWKNLLQKMDEFKLEYQKIEMNLQLSVNSPKIQAFKENISAEIVESLNELLKNY